MARFNPYLLLLFAALLLAGCGNKGPLVLPDQQQAKPKKSQPAAAAPAASEGPGSGNADGRQ
jgi:predicted small lipoprotein YifL